MQIAIEKTLDVEVVERQLAELWQQTAGNRETDDATAVLRARVANLLVFVGTAAGFDECREMLVELTARHPSRVLIMHGDRAADDRDIEMAVESYCQTDKRSGAKRLCCEEVTLKATGKFVVELPSAALPLLVPDLSTFLWWRHAPQAADKVLDRLLRATDRLVIDSAEFADPLHDLGEINQIFAMGDFDGVGISDLNWARLTFWRGLLADFYDVPAYQVPLAAIDQVTIDYVANEAAPAAVAPQAWLLAGWLASRLGWTLAEEQPISENDETLSFKFMSDDRQGSSPTVSERGSSPTVREDSADRIVSLHLNRVAQGERKPGRLAQVELGLQGSSSFRVARSDDNVRLLTEAKLGADTQRGRVLPVRNRSAAQLLSRELEILCNDQIYQEALVIAAKMIDR